MTYNVFVGTLNLTQPTRPTLHSVYCTTFTKLRPTMCDKYCLPRLQNGELQNLLDNAKREKEAAELKVMTQSMQMNTVIDNSKWALESELARKNSELEEVQQKCEKLQASVNKLEAELHELRASSQLELDNCRRACNDAVTGKDAELKDMQMKMDKLQDLLQKQACEV